MVVNDLYRLHLIDYTFVIGVSLLTCCLCTFLTILLTMFCVLRNSESFCKTFGSVDSEFQKDLLLITNVNMLVLHFAAFPAFYRSNIFFKTLCQVKCSTFKNTTQAPAFISISLC